MSIFSERIKETRQKLKLSQQKIAELASLDVRLYQYYESDKRCPSLANAEKISDVLGVSLDFLCGRTDNSEINK